MSELVRLVRELIDVPSISGSEREAGELLVGRLDPLAQRHGGRVERMPVEGERFNVVASWGTPRVVLSSHYDTVPPFLPSSEDDTHVHGRGACDAKGTVAAMMEAARRLLEAGRRDFGLLLLVGEEADSIGAQVANRHPPDGVRHLVNGEPTENALATGSKGALRFEIEARGRMAHSAYPELGDHAIDKLLRALSRLADMPSPVDPVLGTTTWSIGTLQGGRAANVIPDHAAASVFIRTVGPTAPLLEWLRRELRDVEIRVKSDLPAVHLDVLPGFRTTIVRYTTDVPRLTAWGRPLLLGPGSIHLAHAADERVPKAELHEAVDLYCRLVEQLSDSPR